MHECKHFWWAYSGASELRPPVVEEKVVLILKQNNVWYSYWPLEK